MNPISLFKTFVLVVIFAYLSIHDNQAEARTLNDLQNLEEARNMNINDLQAMAHLIDESKLSNPLGQADNDDDEDEDDRTNLQVHNQLMEASLNNYNQRPILAEQTTQQQNKIMSSPSTGDLRTSASHHHHGHGVKGYLDMGAWTGKKGAFGWHDKHPVGKGKK